MAKIIAYIIAESKGWQIQLDSPAHPCLHIGGKIYHTTAVDGIHLMLKLGTFFLSFIPEFPSTKFVYERQPMEVEGWSQDHVPNPSKPCCKFVACDY